LGLRMGMSHRWRSPGLKVETGATHLFTGWRGGKEVAVAAVRVYGEHP
jgi:hypothetical protein